MAQNYYLHLGQSKKQYFTLPTEWVPLHFVEGEEGAPTPSLEQMTAEALSKPIGTRPLQDLLSAAKSVAIIVDDGTRPTPVAEILGVLLSHLTNAPAARGWSNERPPTVKSRSTESHESGLISR